MDATQEYYTFSFPINFCYHTLMAVILLLFGYLFVSYSKWFYLRHLNDRKRLRKQEENRKSIEDLRSKLQKDPIPEDEVKRIGSLSILSLANQLKAGKLSPRTVLKVYQTKALKVHESTNCIVEVIKEAEEWARRLENGPAGGALWGIPVSIKDDVGITGYDNTVGEVERVFKPSKTDSELMKILKREGAIPFVKTNVPQTCFTYEPGNPITGRTLNPHNALRGAGGSSAGEGAIIGGGGSILGIGSDIGGSIRVPAHFNGCVGFKPTPERISPRGMGFDEPIISNSIRPVWGPLARDVDGAALMMKTLLDGDFYSADPETVPMPFKNEEYNGKKRLTVGFYHDNGTFPTAPACKRAIEMSKAIFIKHKHQVVPWQLPEPERCYWLYFRLLQADGGGPLAKVLKHDRVDDCIKFIVDSLKIPIMMRGFVSKLMSFSDPKSAEFMSGCGGVRDVATYQELVYELWLYRRLVHDSWREAGLDLVICPTNVMPAPPFGSAQLLFMGSMYTIAYNLLHYPAGVVRMTNVNKADIENLDKFPTDDQWSSKGKEANLKSEGMPVGVQVVGAKYMDELVLRGMKILEHGSDMPPIT